MKRSDRIRRRHIRRQSEAESGERIQSLECAGERKDDLVHRAGDGDAEALARLGIVPSEEPDVRAAGAEGEHPLPPRPTARSESRHALVAGVEHGGPIRRHDPLEEAGLGGEVGVGVGVIVHVVAGDVGERRRSDADAIQPVLREPMAGRLQRQVLDAVFRELGEHAVQGNGIGRGVFKGSPRAIGVDAEGAEGGSVAARGPPDLAREVRHRGLAVGAGDADHDFRLRTVVARGRDREPETRVGVRHQADPLSKGRVGSVGREHGGGTAGQGFRDEVDARGTRAGECREQVAGAHFARIRGEPRDLHVRRRLWDQARKTHDFPRRPTGRTQARLRPRQARQWPARRAAARCAR